MTRKQFEKLKVGDKVRHAFGGIGVVTEKDENGYVVKDKGFDLGDGMCEVSFAWNEGEIIRPKPIRRQLFDNGIATTTDDIVPLHIQRKNAFLL